MAKAPISANAQKIPTLVDIPAAALLAMAEHLEPEDVAMLSTTCRDARRTLEETGLRGRFRASAMTRDVARLRWAHERDLLPWRDLGFTLALADLTESRAHVEGLRWLERRGLLWEPFDPAVPEHHFVLANELETLLRRSRDLCGPAANVEIRLPDDWTTVRRVRGSDGTFRARATISVLWYRELGQMRTQTEFDGRRCRTQVIYEDESGENPLRRCAELMAMDLLDAFADERAEGQLWKRPSTFDDRKRLPIETRELPEPANLVRISGKRLRDRVRTQEQFLERFPKRTRRSA